MYKKDNVLAHLLIAANLLIAQKWRSEKVPSIYDWQNKCQYLLVMCKLTTIRKGDDDQGLAIIKFENTWTKFIKYWTHVRPQSNITKDVLSIL